jgi:predicted lipoprotein with Yx(FWY)xxD motif
MRNRWLVPVGAIAATLVIAACGSSSTNTGSGSGSGAAGAPASSASAASSGGALSTMKVGSATLLTNAQGFTLYWFVPDTSTASHCNAACAKYWPPVPGPASAGSGVKGTLGVITRSNGAKQATWDGHPLYTYVGDTSPGMAKGNGLNISGGVWHEIILHGTTAPAPKASHSASSGGGAYGY